MLASYGTYTVLMMSDRLKHRQYGRPLVPEPSVFEVEKAIEKPKRHKSSDIEQIPAEMI